MRKATTITQIFIFIKCLLLLFAATSYAAVRFEWQSIEDAPETGGRFRSASLGSDNSHLYFTRCADITSHFYRISAGSTAIGDWETLSDMPIMQDPNVSGDGIGYFDGHLYMFADVAGDAYREIVRYNISGDSWETSNTATDNLGSDTSCVLDDNGYVYGGWRGWNPIEKVTDWQNLTEAWQQSVEGGARHPWDSTRDSNYIYFVTFHENQNADVYRLTATGTGASASQAGTAWKQAPWNVGMGCAIEYVPAHMTSSGNEELWVLRGSDATTGDGNAGGPTDDFAIYDLATDMWLQFDLPKAYGLGSDMERVGQYMYFLQGGSTTGTDVFMFTEIGLDTTNRTPHLAGMGDQRVIAGYTLNRNVTASDPDGDTLTLSCNTSSLPGATFVDNGDNSGTFSWSPTPADAGVYPGIVFTVTDGVFTNTDTITITVTNLADAVDVYINDIYVSEPPGKVNLYTLDTSFDNASIPSGYDAARINVCVIPGYYDFGTGFTGQGISNGVIGVPDIDPADVRDQGDASAQWVSHGQFSRSGSTNGASGTFTGHVYELDPSKYWVINEPVNNGAIVLAATFSAYVDALNMQKNHLSWPLSLGTNQFTLIAPGGAGELLDEGIVGILMSTSQTLSYTNNTPPSVCTLEQVLDGGEVLDVGLGSYDEWEVGGHYTGDEYFYSRPADIIVASPSYEAEFYPYRVTITYWNMAGDNYSAANPFGLSGFATPGWAEQGSPWLDGVGSVGIDNAVDDTVCYLELFVEEIPEPGMFLGILLAISLFIRRS